MLQRDRLVVFGGADEIAFAGTATYMKDTWVYDLEAGAWSLLDDGSSTAPEGRFWPTVVYDDRTDAVLLFGGHDDGQLGTETTCGASRRAASGSRANRATPTTSRPTASATFLRTSPA
ncbi:MAG: kelch repeat-containing protein [Polyangiaceae bacterium]